MKGADGEAGNNARQALRFLEGLRLSGDLVKGVALPSRGTVRLEVNHVDADLPQGLDPNSRAGRVLKVCRGLMDEGTPATLVSRDMVARIRAQMIGVPAEDFTTNRLPDGARPYTGRAEVYIPDDLLPVFKKKGVPPEELYTVDGARKQRPVSLTENQFVLLRSDTDPKKTMLGRFYGEKVTVLRFGSVRPFGVKPRSVGQQFLQEALLLPAEEASSRARPAPPRPSTPWQPGWNRYWRRRKGLIERSWCAVPTHSLTRISVSSPAVNRRRSPPHAAHCGQFGNSAGSGGEEKGAASVPRPWSCARLASCAPSWPSWPPPPACPSLTGRPSGRRAAPLWQWV